MEEIENVVLNMILIYFHQYIQLYLIILLEKELDMMGIIYEKIYS